MNQALQADKMNVETNEQQQDELTLLTDFQLDHIAGGDAAVDWGRSSS